MERRQAKPSWQSVQQAVGQLHSVRGKLASENNKLKKLEEQQAKLQKQVEEVQDSIVALEHREKELKQICENIPDAARGDSKKLVDMLPSMLGVDLGPDEETNQSLDKLQGLAQQLLDKQPRP